MAKSEWRVTWTVLNGTLPHRKVGSKFLLDVDTIIKYFEGGIINE